MTMEDAEILSNHKAAEREGYMDVAVVNGQVCGLLPFMFTHGIVVGIDETGYSHRYCYPNFLAAKSAYAEWIVDGGDEPKGYIKRKP